MYTNMICSFDSKAGFQRMCHSYYMFNKNVVNLVVDVVNETVGDLSASSFHS